MAPATVGSAVGDLVGAVVGPVGISVWVGAGAASPAEQELKLSIESVVNVSNIQSIRINNFSTYLSSIRHHLVVVLVMIVGIFKNKTIYKLILQYRIKLKSLTHQFLNQWLKIRLKSIQRLLMPRKNIRKSDKSVSFEL